MVTDVARIRYALVFLGQAARSSGFRGLREFLQWLEEVYGAPEGEPPPQTPWRVVKRDEKIEPFQQAKLERSVRIASKGRGSEEEVRRRTNQIVTEVHSQLQGQAIVASHQIAAEVVKLLLRSDPMAYLRYSSVMKRYRSIEDFWMDALALNHGMNDPS